jgi:hypothetical protein
VVLDGAYPHAGGLNLDPVYRDPVDTLPRRLLPTHLQRLGSSIPLQHNDSDESAWTLERLGPLSRPLVMIAVVSPEWRSESAERGLPTPGTTAWLAEGRYAGLGPLRVLYRRRRHEM